MASRAIVLQQKTQRLVQFEITEPTREAVGAWIGHARLTSESSLFPSRLHARHICLLGSTRGSWIPGSGSWDWTRRATGRTPQANEGDLDLPPDQEPAGRPAAAGTHEAGEYGSLPRH
jgi:hypothetical protein